MTKAWWIALAASLVAIGACTHGPPEDRSVAYAARIPYGRELVVVVHHERLRPATGLSAFPDGGVARILLQEVRVYWANASTGELREWAHLELPKSFWSATRVGVAGVAADTVYMVVSGCADSPCPGDHWDRRIYRVTSGSTVAVVEQVPRHHLRPGGSVAPMERETAYLRVGDIHRDSLTVRLEYPDDSKTLFRITPGGELKPSR